MVGSKCNWKTHVQYPGYPFPLQIGDPKTTFLGRLRNLRATLTAYIFGMKHDMRWQLQGVSYIVPKCHVLNVTPPHSLYETFIFNDCWLCAMTGYGNQIPRTTVGLLVSLPYAVVGIPLTFCFLSRAGRDLARGLLSVYRRFCCDLLCCKRCQRNRRRRIYSLGGRRVGYQRSLDGATYVAANSVGQYRWRHCQWCHTRQRLTLYVL